ncbi:site-specific integrase [Candidatus Babeliales bacterium]|nr:site-specific integrase [Candidatus Babeliales bacterium]
MSVRKIRASWWIDFRFNNSRYRKKSPVNSKAGAYDYEALLRQKLARGESIEEEKTEKKQLFSEFAWYWFETYAKTNNKHSEILNKEGILRVHLVPFFGKVKLDNISNQLVEKYKREKQKTRLCNKSINNHLTVLRKCLETALEWQILETTPRVKLLKTPPSKFDYLNESECKLLLDNSNGNLHDMILLALNTGLRFGELIALTWKDIDFEKRLLTINKAIAKGVLGSTKSNKNRYIPLTTSVIEMLRNRKRDTELIFSENDSFLGQARYVKKLHKLCKDLKFRRIGWHVLRHTFASHLAQKGISLKAIQELLGHSDIKTTMRYAHLSPRELRQAVDVLSFGQQVGNASDFILNLPTSYKDGQSDFSPYIKQKTELFNSVSCE